MQSLSKQNINDIPFVYFQEKVTESKKAKKEENGDNDADNDDEEVDGEDEEGNVTFNCIT